ncbi:hypothetical protein ACJX0J_012178, partial [Zea mays]
LYLFFILRDTLLHNILEQVLYCLLPRISHMSVIWIGWILVSFVVWLLFRVMYNQALENLSWNMHRANISDVDTSIHDIHFFHIISSI